jgi:hypothetical protein
MQLLCLPWHLQFRIAPGRKSRKANSLADLQAMPEAAKKEFLTL